MKKIAIAFVLSVAVAAPAFASGPYVGVRAGQAKASYDNATLTTDSATGLGVFGGFAFNPNIAVEAEYLSLGEVKGGGFTAKSSGFSVGAVGSFPINEQFSLFGKLGYAMLVTKVTPAGVTPDLKGNAITYGLGGQYNVSPSVGIRLGWDSYKLDDSSQNFKGKNSMISVGGVFKF